MENMYTSDIIDIIFDKEHITLYKGYYTRVNMKVIGNDLIKHLNDYTSTLTFFSDQANISVIRYDCKCIASFIRYMSYMTRELLELIL